MAQATHSLTLSWSEALLHRSITHATPKIGPPRSQIEWPVHVSWPENQQPQRSASPRTITRCYNCRFCSSTSPAGHTVLPLGLVGWWRKGDSVRVGRAPAFLSQAGPDPLDAENVDIVAVRMLQVPERVNVARVDARSLVQDCRKRKAREGDDLCALSLVNVRWYFEGRCACLPCIDLPGAERRQRA